jgi:signal transduction histidine kinase
MAEQAGRINGRDPGARLAAPQVNDELGRLAASFNALLDRLASTLSLQRQFMADASHELSTPVSVVRTATEVILGNEVRSADEYRESLVLVGEQANRLSRRIAASNGR